MVDNFSIEYPFFEIGPKAYVYGEEALKIAKAADAASKKYGVEVIYTPQYTDINRIAANTKNIHVFAQHMDPIEPGRGIGAVLAEALKEAGAEGVLLNHAERKMTLSDIGKAIKRADEVGLATLVCADNILEAVAIAQFRPNIILAEPEALIGTKGTGCGERDYIKVINDKINEIDPRIKVLHSAGISNPQDVYDMISSGADATGCTSAIILADDPCDMTDKMLHSVKKAFTERKVKK